MIFPNHLHIETVNGLCTARCTMCVINTSKRKPSIMSQETFKNILEKFLPYRNHLQYLSLFWNGEPLLDKGLSAKIKLAKEMGFNSVGFATNCTELTASTSYELLKAGLDTLICSVDGITKETHEEIRIGTDYDQVVDNILTFLEIRNRFGHAKVVIRFICQKSNAHEWEDFKEWWKPYLNPSIDMITSFDIIDVDGKVENYGEKDVLSNIESPKTCDQLNNRMIVMSAGNVALCCADLDGKFNLGNVLEKDPVEIFNGPKFNLFRELISMGRIKDLDLCNKCTIPRSVMMKEGK